MKLRGLTFLGVAEAIATSRGRAVVFQAACDVPAHEAIELSKECERMILESNNGRPQFFIFLEGKIHDAEDWLLVQRCKMAEHFKMKHPENTIYCLEANVDPPAKPTHGATWQCDLLHFLGYVAARVRLQGWVSKSRLKRGDGDATANVVMKLLNPLGRRYDNYPELRARHARELTIGKPGDQDEREAELALKWALDLEDDEMEGNTYLANLNAVVRCGVVDEHTAGLGANVVREYQKHLKRLTKNE